MTLSLKLLLLLLFAFPLTPKLALGQSVQSESLRGLKGIRVVVGNVRTTNLPVNAKPDTPTPEEVKKEAEFWLKNFDINVVNSTDPNVASLHLTLMSEKDSNGANHFDLAVRLAQEVTLVRDPSIKMRAPTWDYSLLGTVSGTNPFEGVICRAVAPFINAFKLANGAKVPLDETAMCMQ